MQTTKKKLLLPISIVATALVTGGVVYAFSSSSFLTQAQNYVSSQCNSALISSKNTVANNQKATICYNYYKNIEQDVSLSNLSNKSNAVPYLVDGNGNVLGNYIDNLGQSIVPLYTYFDSILNLKISIRLQTGNLVYSIWPYYASQDCSGTAYQGPGNTPVTQTLFVTGADIPTKQYFYISSNDAATVPVVLSSYWSGGVCTPTNATTHNSSTYKLTQISPNITFPIALPVTIK
jgi:hypothetical protein